MNSTFNFGYKWGDYPGNSDFSIATALAQNISLSVKGFEKGGSFDIEGQLARSFIDIPNPHAKSNADILHPYWNAMDVVQRRRDVWIIDFGAKSRLEEAQLYEAPYAHLEHVIQAERAKNREKRTKNAWWKFRRSGEDVRKIIARHARVIVTPLVSKHRIFAWMPTVVYPANLLVLIASDNDATFGILHSRMHRLWSLRICTFLGKGNDPRYTPTTCFETFPFPKDFPLRSSASSAVNDFDFDSIAQAARRLDELRNNWLNPPEWIERIPEVVPGYPDRIIAKPGHEADLKKRTLTNLYNARPAWLDNIHKQLDAAVAAAYGWDDYTPDMPDEEILARLFNLNRESQ